MLKHIQDGFMSCAENLFCPTLQGVSVYKMATKIVMTVYACCINVPNFELVFSSLAVWMKQVLCVSM